MFDVSLLSQLREGNREAFNSLFRHYYPRVMAYVAAMVEQEVAEDVVQDVFLHVWENRKSYTPEKGFILICFRRLIPAVLIIIEKHSQPTSIIFI